MVPNDDTYKKLIWFIAGAGVVIVLADIMSKL